MKFTAALMLTLVACVHTRTAPLPAPGSSPGAEPAATADPAEGVAPIGLREQAAAFTLPAPEQLDGEFPDLWSTHYHLWESTEAAADDGFVVLDSDDRPFPAAAPLHLTGRDWCFTALEGSGRVVRLDGTAVTINYSGQGDVAVPCERWLGARWRSQGRVRFGFAVGPFGDGVRQWQLVPFRTLAVDPDTIPYGTTLFIAEAVGDEFEHEGVAYTHDGWFFAADTGGAIRLHHVDTFTGTTTDPSLDFVRSDPDAARFVASQVPADDPIAAMLGALHEGE